MIGRVPDLTRVVQDLLDLGQPRLPRDAVVDVLVRHGLIPSADSLVSSGRYECWPQPRGSQVDIGVIDGEVRDLSLAPADSPTDAPTDAAALAKTLATRPNASRPKKAKGVHTIVIGGWQIVIRPEQDGYPLRTDIDEVHVWHDLLAAADAYLNNGFSMEWARASRFASASDRATPGRVEWWGVDRPRVELDDAGLVHLGLTVPRDWARKGRTKDERFEAMAADLDALGPRWADRAGYGYGWRHADRAVTLSWARSDPDFHLEFSTRRAGYQARVRVDDLTAVSGSTHPSPSSPSDKPDNQADAAHDLLVSLTDPPRQSRADLRAAIDRLGLLDASIPMEVDGPDHLATLTFGAIVRCGTRDGVVVEVTVQLAPQGGGPDGQAFWTEVADRFGPKGRMRDVGFGRRVGAWALKEYLDPFSPVTFTLSAQDRWPPRPTEDELNEIADFNLTKDESLTLLTALTAIPNNAEPTRQTLLSLLLDHGIVASTALQQIGPPIGPEVDPPAWDTSTESARPQARPIGATVRLHGDSPATVKRLEVTLASGLSTQEASATITSLRRSLAARYEKAMTDLDGEPVYRVDGALVSVNRRLRHPSFDVLLHVSLPPPL